MELIQRDEINVAYILCLLAALGAETQGEGADTRKAQRTRKQIFDLLATEISLRNKAPFIRKFIEEVMPGLPEKANIRKGFNDFWDTEREAALGELRDREGIDLDRLESMMRKMTFEGKVPLGDEVINALQSPPGIVGRRVIVRRVIESIKFIIATFDDGVGELIESW